MWVNEDIALYIPNLSTRQRLVVTFTPWSHFCQWKSPWYQLDMKLGGPQSRSRCNVKEKNVFPLPAIKSQFLNCLAHSLVALPAELSQLLVCTSFTVSFHKPLNFVMKLKSLHFFYVVQQLIKNFVPHKSHLHRIQHTLLTSGVLGR
jgi:hypothetical protein